MTPPPLIKALKLFLYSEASLVLILVCGIVPTLVLMVVARVRAAREKLM
jgi:hypothetical protein